MLNVIILSVVMLNVIMMSVIMLRVEALKLVFMLLHVALVAFIIDLLIDIREYIDCSFAQPACLVLVE